MKINKEELRAQIDKKFEGLTVNPFPSPHLMISDFFPADIYKKLLEYNPFRDNRGREWISTKEMKIRRQATPYDRRKQLDVATGEFEGPQEVREFWASLGDTMLGDHWLAKRMYRTFPQYFDIRFGEAVLEPNFWGELRRMMFVQRHEPGYDIGPHTDTPHRVFTCIFAFADDDKHEDYGTQFVRPKDPRVRCWGDLHHKPDDFEVVTVSKYRPNNFVVFFKTRQSFHSVKHISEELPNQRYGMQIGYYESGHGLFRDLSRPDLMRDRTTKPLFEFRAFGKTLQLNRN